MSEQVSVYSQPELENASLIVGWKEDEGKLGAEVIGYLNEHIKGKNFCEIEPVKFFPLDGVAIDNNLVQFPTSRFYAGERKDIVLFESNEPVYRRYEFLNCLLDVAEHYCNIKYLYTVSGTISAIAHTSPRKLLTVFNQSEFQKRFRGYDLVDMTWEGPPAINSFLLWLAQRRGIPGLSLWPEITFYLATTEDPRAAEVVLSFFDRKFNLGLDLSGLNLKIRNQNEKIILLRKQEPQIDKYIRTLEVGISLSNEEQLTLVRKVTDFLSTRT